LLILKTLTSKLNSDDMDNRAKIYIFSIENLRLKFLFPLFSHIFLETKCSANYFCFNLLLVIGSMIAAEKLLLEAALEDLANQRFVLLSDRSVPLPL